MNPALRTLTSSAALVCAASLLLSGEARAWAPKKAPLMTRWASQVSPTNALPEYPRPQLVRSQWLNLNGLWQYQSGKEGDRLPAGRKLSGQILVPYPVESALSGVMEHHDRLWYRRSFTVPTTWKNKRTKLHFGAVDYEAEIYVNGQSAGIHRGGYEPFTLDITPFLRGSGPQELIVRVFDPTDLGGQPRGKQTLKPGGIMYTPTTGIWQTVWLEPVAHTSISNLHMIPDVDRSRIRFTVNADNATPLSRAVVSISDMGRVIKTVAVKPGVETAIPLPNAKLWSPNRPFLYNVKVSLLHGNSPSDTVSSYFGMRKISVGRVNGVPKMLLNNKFVFQMGPLDQGFWPDGIYTAPTDAALRSDLEMEKKLGFNMVRKHIKIEPARWYYYADKLGLMVWQDMPSPNSYTGNAPPVDSAAFEKQMRSVITEHWNSPAIIMWVIFNEGQGRHDTRQLVDLARKIDPSRLANRDSGAGYEKEGDGDVGNVDDIHNYPPPGSPVANMAQARAQDPNQALACGEYGGIGYVVKGHTWRSGSWGYTSVPNARDLEDTYGEYSAMIKGFRDERGMSAAVYTQISDVEVEINGLMTYDRILKPNAARIALANRFAYPVPVYKAFVPTSESAAQTWKYIFTNPPADWIQPSFDDSPWQVAKGGFGSDAPAWASVGTPWTSDDIWLRRTFTLGNLSPTQVSQLMVRLYHDDNVQVYINGVLAYENNGANSSYEYKAMSEEAKRALVLGGQNTLAVHCKETGGGQFIDIGISQKIPAVR